MLVVGTRWSPGEECFRPWLQWVWRHE